MLDIIHKMDRAGRKEFLEMLASESSACEGGTLRDLNFYADKDSDCLFNYGLSDLLSVITYKGILSILSSIRVLSSNLNIDEVIMHQVSNALLKSAPTACENTMRMYNIIMSSNKLTKLPSRVFEKNKDGICFADLVACVVPCLPLPRVCMLFSLFIMARDPSEELFDIDLNDYFDVIEYASSSIPVVNDTLKSILRDFSTKPSLVTVCELWWFLDFFEANIGEIRGIIPTSQSDRNELINCFRNYKLFSSRVSSLFYVSLKYRAYDGVDRIPTVLEDSNGVQCRQLLAEINYYKKYLSAEQLTQVEEYAKSILEEAK